MSGQHSTGKGDRYRRVDRNNWERGWDLAFPKETPVDRKKYVVCFVFTADFKKVVLIYKQRGPSSVIDHWNGVGGKIEPGESPEQASSREVFEETGLEVPEREWKSLGILEGPSYSLHFLWVVDENAIDAVTKETEPVAVVPTHSLPSTTMPNVHWMIPMIRDGDVDSFGTLPMNRG